jgi:hypothetical protein
LYDGKENPAYEPPIPVAQSDLVIGAVGSADGGLTDGKVDGVVGLGAWVSTDSIKPFSEARRFNSWVSWHIILLIGGLLFYIIPQFLSVL